MRSLVRLIVIGGAVLVCGAAFWTTNQAGAHRSACPAYTASFERLERERIRAHLARVERELRGREVSGLSARQLEARAGNLDVLHAYWKRGRFPHNHDFPGERIPYFVDAHGTRCAMAHLIEASGGGDLVRRVAATHNNARVRELAADRELVAWLDQAGLTAAEAARIQPEYGHSPPFNDVVLGRRADGIYPEAAAVTSVVEASAIALNANTEKPWSQRRPRAAFGVLAGVLGMAVGATGLASETPIEQIWGYVAVTLSAANLGLSIRSLNVHRPDEEGVQASAARARTAFYMRTNRGGPPQLTVSVVF